MIQKIKKNKKKSIIQKTFNKQNNELNNNKIYNSTIYFIYQQNKKQSKIIQLEIQNKPNENPSTPKTYEIFKNEKEYILIKNWNQIINLLKIPINQQAKIKQIPIKK